MLRRVGMFFLLVGLMIMFIFFPSGSANTESLTIFCSGIPFVILGISMWLRSRDSTPAERFRLLRMLSRKKEEEEKGKEEE
jgi:hypothetical protein